MGPIALDPKALVMTAWRAARQHALVMRNAVGEKPSGEECRARQPHTDDRWREIESVVDACRLQIDRTRDSHAVAHRQIDAATSALQGLLADIELVMSSSARRSGAAADPGAGPLSTDAHGAAPTVQARRQAAS